MEVCHHLVFVSTISPSHLGESEEKSQKSCAKHLQECREWAQGKQFMTGCNQQLTPSQRTEQFIYQEVKIFQWCGGNDSWKIKLLFLRSFQRVQSGCFIVIVKPSHNASTLMNHLPADFVHTVYVNLLWLSLNSSDFSLLTPHQYCMYCALSLTLSC